MTDQQSLAMWVLIGVFALMFGAILFVVFKKKPHPSHTLESSLDSSSTEKTQVSEDQKTKSAESDENSAATLMGEPTEAIPAHKSPMPAKSPMASGAPEPVTMKQALSNTEKNLWGRFKSLFSSEASAHHFEEIEEILYTSDLGPATVERVLDVVKSDLSKSEKSNIDSIKEALKKEFIDIFEEANIPEPLIEEPFKHLNMQTSPSVWLIVGVNGAGKTTSIGKIASRLAQSGKRVLVAAGDTFRAAAESQLKVWTERAQVEIFSPSGVADPSAVAFDAVSKAKAQGYDIVLIDTAGRLHTQVNLMEELKKIQRVMKKVLPEAPHETLLVLDGNSGQNALLQAKQFHQALGVTGIVLTKMDGSAKGGVAVGIAHELKVPIRFIGIGEKVTDLRPFSAKEFVDSIF